MPPGLNQDRLRQIERKERELNEARLQEETLASLDSLRRKQRQGAGDTPTPPPLPQVPPPELTPNVNGAANRLDMLVGGGNIRNGTPTKRVSFQSAPIASPEKEEFSTDINDEKLNRLELVEKDPNVRFPLLLT